MIYVPEELIINKENKEKIFEITRRYNPSGIESLEFPKFDVVGELKKIGEYKLAEGIQKGKLIT